jgi:hypothetical protein
LACIEAVCTTCGTVGEACCPVVVIAGSGGAPSDGGAASGGDDAGGDGTGGTTPGFVNDGCPGPSICGDDQRCAAP